MDQLREEVKVMSAQLMRQHNASLDSQVSVQCGLVVLHSPTSVILLQIVMVCPGTHFVKNDRSQSRTNESQLKKKPADPKLKMLGPLCDQTVNLKTDVS